MSQQSLIPESCDSILDTAKIVHAEELARFNQCESKTNIGLAFSGIMLGSYLTYLSTFKPDLTESSYLIYSFLFKAAIFTILTIGIMYFLKSIKVGTYEQIDLDNIVDLEFATDNETKVKFEIAATYKTVVNNNKRSLELKLKYYGTGLKYLTGGFLLFTIHFFIEEVISI